MTIQMACPGRGPGAQSLSWEDSSDPGGAQHAPALHRASPAVREEPLSRSPPAPQLPPPESFAGRSLIRPEPALFSRRPKARGLVSPRRLCEEQDEALVISTPIPPTSCLPSWATKGPREAGPLRLPAPLQPC